jgi:hypothetical protein
MTSGDIAMHSLLEEPSTSSAMENCGLGDRDGGLNTTQSSLVVVVTPGRDRMSAALSRIVTTTTIVVGYIP